MLIFLYEFVNYYSYSNLNIESQKYSWGIIADYLQPPNKLKY